MWSVVKRTQVGTGHLAVWVIFHYTWNYDIPDFLQILSFAGYFGLGEHSIWKLYIQNLGNRLAQVQLSNKFCFRRGCFLITIAIQIMSDHGRWLDNINSEIRQCVTYSVAMPSPMPYMQANYFDWIRKDTIRHKHYLVRYSVVMRFLFFSGVGFPIMWF